MIAREYVILPNVSYVHKIDHRNGAADKSQWTISETEERDCFGVAYCSWRCNEHDCWGLRFVNDQAVYLGITKRSSPEKRDLFVAKFLDSNRNNKWHGYPADHVVNHQDIPPAEVLVMWLTAQLLRPAVIRKLSRGQKCRL